jgi:hypothetical protein
VILVGNLGADPEIRHTQDGRPVANLSVATSESWRDKASGERREKTEYTSRWKRWYHPHCMNDPQPEGHVASHIGRRKFLASLGGAAALPLAARAQPDRIRRVGVLIGRAEGRSDIAGRQQHSSKGSLRQPRPAEAERDQSGIGRGTGRRTR